MWCMIVSDIDFVNADDLNLFNIVDADIFFYI
jgi:hypothetical protein